MSVGLIDITPCVETIDVRGHAVDIGGLTVATIGRLMLRFPELRRMAETNSWDQNALLQMSDETINAVIAAAAPQRLTEAAAANLSLGEKSEIVAAVIRQTAPRGLGPFVDLMRALGLVGVAASGTALATSSEPPPNI